MDNYHLLCFTSMCYTFLLNTKSNLHAVFLLFRFNCKKVDFSNSCVSLETSLSPFRNASIIVPQSFLADRRYKNVSFVVKKMFAL